MRAPAQHWHVDAAVYLAAYIAQRSTPCAAQYNAETGACVVPSAQWSPIELLDDEAQ